MFVNAKTATAPGAFACALVGENETFEYRRQHGDGHWIWLKNRTIGRYQRDGETFVEGMLTDITEHKRLEERLRQAGKGTVLGLSTCSGVVLTA